MGGDLIGYPAFTWWAVRHEKRGGAGCGSSAAVPKARARELERVLVEVAEDDGAEANGV